jgi:hypothetical protein
MSHAKIVRDFHAVIKDFQKAQVTFHGCFEPEILRRRFIPPETRWNYCARRV